MPVRVDPERTRDERRRRGWSQLHLAMVSGLGLRTIQRIERSGAASYDSAQALAACFDVPLGQLLAPERNPEAPRARVVARRTAIAGMAASFVAGALLMTMHGVAAEDLFIDLGISLAADEDEYRTPVFLVDGERSELSLPDGYRLAITPTLAGDGTVRLDFEIYDDSEEPAELLSRPAIVTTNGREFRIVQGTSRGADASQAPSVLDITGKPVLLDAERRAIDPDAGNVPPAAEP
jgi:transcriptional regulator with XRE-family HTH domain